ncbi:MAG: J domain-containing protein [Cyanobacteriota bacterium]|nr:J domain-containing protein [Cyanobacteriota bacterium]
MSTSPGDGPDARTATPPPWPSGAALDPYQLLEVPASASPDELRRAFRRLSKLVHPDTTSLPAAQAQEAFLKLSQAYALLSDPLRRRVYDAQRGLEAGAGGAAGPGGARGAAPGAASVRIGTRPLPVRRALSGGEWFALVLLAIALVLSLVLGLGVAWARGTELVRQPSWWAQQTPLAEPAVAEPVVTETGVTETGPAARVAPAPTAPRPQAPPPAPGPTTTTRSPSPTPSSAPTTRASAPATRSTTSPAASPTPAATPTSTAAPALPAP